MHVHLAIEKPDPLRCSLSSLYHYWPNNRGRQCNCPMNPYAKHAPWCGLTPIYASLVGHHTSKFGGMRIIVDPNHIGGPTFT
jgi:hypothetical protein